MSTLIGIRNDVVFAVSVILLITGALSPAYGQATENQPVDTELLLDELLTELQQTLVRVSDAIDEDDLPRLSKATLNLKTTLGSRVGGKLSLIAVELGTEVAMDSVVEISLELEPPRESDPAPVSSVDDLLADAIIASLKAVRVAETRRPPLHLHKLVATVRFGIEYDAGGGIRFKALSFGVGVKTATIHEMIVEFEEEE